MSESPRCPVCQTRLPRDGPEGFCPPCSFVGALDAKPKVGEGRSEIGEQRSAVSEGEIQNRNSKIADQFGDYEMLEEIAHGGMGVVWKARQLSLNRIVAVKLIRAGPFASKEFVHRFRVEASAAAVLQHPNIVAVHEVGVHEGQHFFSMDYVEGKNLAQLVREGPLPPTRAARYVQKIAEAMHYAHTAGILHRDLKPSNVLIDAQDQPRITDFGLAKQLHSDSSVTLTGEVIGTPAYMAPEQASRNRGAVKGWTDVYSLGAILYHLLAGRAPFIAGSLEETIQQVLHQDPPSVRLLNPVVPRDLNTICLKCLEKEPAKRYATAQLLADELGRFLNQEPILARPLSTVGRAWRWCRRNPRVASAATVALLSLVTGLAGVTWQWRRATANEVFALQNVYAADMRMAQFAVDANNRSLAITLLNKHRNAHPRIQSEKGSVNLPPPPGGLRSQLAADLRGWEWRYLWRLCQGEDSFTLAKYPRLITGLAASKNGDFLAVAARGELAIWDLKSRRLLNRQWVGVRRALAFSPVTNILAMGATNGAGKPAVLLCEVNTAKAIKTFEHPARCVAFSPNGQLLATFDPSGKVRILSLSSDREVDEFEVRPAAWYPDTGVVSFSPDGTQLAIGEDDGKVRVVDLKTRDSRSMQTETRAGVLAIAFSPNSEVLAASRDLQGDISLWDPRSGKLLGQLSNHDGAVRTIAFTPDSRQLVSAGADSTIRIWNVSDHLQTRCFRTSGQPLWSMTLLPDGRTVVSGGAGGSVCFWDMAGGVLPGVHTNIAVSADWNVKAGLDPENLESETPDSRVVRRLGLAFTPDSRSFVTMDTAGGLVLWDARSLQQTEALPEFGSNHWALALSPDGHWLATGDLPGGITIWDWFSRRPVTHFSVTFHWVGHLDFSSSGRFLICRVLRNDRARAARVWRADTWEEVLLPGAPSEMLLALDLSPNDEQLAVGGSGEPVKLFRFPSGQFQAKLAQVSAAGLHFSHDGKGLYTTSYDHTAALWDLASGELVAKLRGHWAAALGLDLSPDESRLATGGETAADAVKVWDLNTQRELLSLRGGGMKYVRITFSPDGNALAATALSGCVDVWRAPSWAEIEEMEREAKVR